MHLEKLQLVNFKNYGTASLEFPSKINVLVGNNGSGKTNLLDAIYYLAFTKSAFQSSDNLLIRHDQSHFFLRGAFRFESSMREVTAGLQPGTKKVVQEDKVEYEKLSDHIGKYPVVLIGPDDVDLIKSGSEVRRKFFDGIISQIDNAYLENLIRYNQTLKQRNSMLKMFAETLKKDFTALDTYDDMLATYGIPVFQKRKEFIRQFAPVFNHFFNFLVDDKEIAQVSLISGVTEAASFKQGLLRGRERDIATLRTNFGPHRDDYEFTLVNAGIKKFGSQGQQKSFAIALKLAQWEIIRNIKGFKPILLLDDIFDKLDDNRISRLLELIKNRFGQLFVTDARPDRTQNLLKRVEVEAAVFEVKEGTLTKI